jgi:hypothetical protein
MTLDLFEELGEKPDMMGVIGRGFSGQAAGFGRTLQRLERTGFGPVEALDLFSTLPGYKQVAFGWRVSCSLHKAAKLIAFGFANELAELDDTRCARIIEGFGTLVRTAYGIAYRRELGKGPILYAYGLAAGLGYDEEERRESESISRWRRTLADGSAVSAGRLRDVYPYNCLSDRHLSLRVKHEDLAAWIAQSSGRGRLHPLSGGLVLWEVPVESVQAVRAALLGEGVLLCS